MSRTPAPPASDPPPEPAQTAASALARWCLAHELNRISRYRLDNLSLAERLYYTLKGPYELFHHVIGYALDAAVRGNRARYERLSSGSETDEVTTARFAAAQLRVRVLALETLLQRVLDTAPRCYKPGCRCRAVYHMPTAVLGDAVRTCAEHRTSDGNEFDEPTEELRWAPLHRDIERALRLREPQDDG